MDSNTLWCRIYSTPLKVDDVASFLYNNKAGGVNIFVGITREWTGDKRTTSLSYEAYEPMAIKEMQALMDEACRTWPVVKACLIHRVGNVPAAEPSVIIGVATPHRKDAFEACRFLIDQLKVKVPIWKKETYSDGSEEWVNPAGKEKKESSPL